MRNKQGFFYGSAVLMASMAVVKLFGAFFKIPLAAFLRETGMGYFSSAYTVYTVVYALAVSGLSTAEAQLTSSYRAKGKATGRILRASLLLFVLLGLIGTLVVMLSARSLSQWMNSPDAMGSILTLAPSLLFCCMMAAFRGYYEGCSDMRPTAAVQIVEAVVKAAAGLLFACLALNHGITQYEHSALVYGIDCVSREEAIQASIPFASAAAMLGVTCSTAAGALVLLFYHKRRPHDRAGNESLSSLCRILLKSAAPIAMAALVMQLSSVIDTLTINRQLVCALADGASDAYRYQDYLAANEPLEGFLYGCFMNGMTLFHIVPAFCAVFGKSALPVVVSAWTIGERTVLSERLSTIFRISVSIAAPLSFGLAAISSSVLSLLYPSLPGMRAVGETLLPILAAASFFFALLSPLQAVMQGINQSRIFLRAVFFGALIKLGCNLLLIRHPSLHIIGAAVGTLACYAFLSLYCVVWLKRHLPIRFPFIKIVYKPIFGAFLSAFSAFLMQKALTNCLSGSIIAFVSFGTGAVVYAAALLVLRVFRRSDFSFAQK